MLFLFFQALVPGSDASAGPAAGFHRGFCLRSACQTERIFLRSHQVRHWPCLRPYLLKSSGQACLPDLTQHWSIPPCHLPSSTILVLSDRPSGHWDSMVGHFDQSNAKLYKTAIAFASHQRDHLGGSQGLPMLLYHR